MPRKLELLSPARNLEVGTAAIMAGADAVYIGGPSFGARSAAGNSIEDITALCAFAHRFGAHVYMTVNTLLYDHELEGVEQLIADGRKAGIDGIIVQDPAVLTMEAARGLEIHASTQMNIDTLDKVAFCKKLGFGQIVVPREFSLDEIRSFCQTYPEIRFEVFVSGALCVSVSGICYISETMTDRSANRGSCAQICRLPMDMFHHDRKNPEAPDEKIASGHLLSMKDNLRLHELEDLVEAGASSFKIEGRLKDRDYVVNQVAAFRERLDKIIAASNGRYERSSSGVVSRGFIPDVSKTFNRGFTSAWLHGDNANMTNTSSPKSLGELMGKVTALSSTQLPCSDRRTSGNRGAAQRGHNGRNGSAHGAGGACTGGGTSGGSGGAWIDMRMERATMVSNGDSYTFFDATGELTGFRVNRVTLIDDASTGRSSSGKSASGGRKGGNGGKGAKAAKSGWTEVKGVRKGETAQAAAATSSAAAGAAAPAGSIAVQPGQTVRLHLLSAIEGMSVGCALHRNVDAVYIRNINMPKALVRRMPLQAGIAFDGNNVVISFADELGRSGSASVSIGEVHASLMAENPDFDLGGLNPLKPEVMLSKMVKLGDDNVSLAESAIKLDISEPEKLLMPLSAFNSLRRAALQDYLSTAQLTREQCRERNLAYMGGTTDCYIFPGLNASGFAAAPVCDPDSADLIAAAVTSDPAAAANAAADAAAAAAAGAEGTPAPEYDNELDFMGGIDSRLVFNERSRAFYMQHMGGRLEPPKPIIEKAVMTCRNCLIKNHAVCHDDGGSTVGYYLLIGKHRFNIVTNCKRCLMYLVPAEGNPAPVKTAG